MWDTACLDWEERLLSGRSLVPDLPLFREEAARALAVFKRLRIPDLIGQPTMADACGPWFFPIVEALFGAYDPSTNRRIIQEVFELIPKKNSKALALDTLVATPTGFVTIADAKVGDEVLAADGTVTVITAKSTVFVDHECYEVEFSTGEKIVCDAGHLWVTDAHRDRERLNARGERTTPRPRAKTTEEIARSLKVPSGRYEINNHRTELCGPLGLPHAGLPIDPYVLGVWLGDGTATQAALTLNGDDAEQIVKGIAAAGQPVWSRKLDGRNAVYASLAGQRGGSCFRADAKALGLFGRKHIPRAYLRASHWQRSQLLRGLMDTDGSASANGQASLTTIFPELRDDFVELVNSLGFKASVREDRAKIDGVDHGPCWMIQFWPLGAVVFLVDRKQARCAPPREGLKARSTARQIVACRPVPSRPVQCISIAHPGRQFLITRSLIPTHNSSNGGAVMTTALIMNRRPEAEFLLIAPTMEIANIALKQAKGTVKADPALDALFQVQDHLKKITHRNTGATLQIKAADTDVITGGKALGTMIDETHVFAKHSRAMDVFIELRGALAARPDGFLFQTTTQSKEPPSGVFKAELERARAVRDGRMKLPLLPILYELPKSVTDSGGWKDRKYWAMVNPNLNRSVNEEFLANELMVAETEGPQKLALIASQHFNVEIGLSLRDDRWPGADSWQSAALPRVTLAYIIANCECATVGVDGGGLDDLFAVAVIGRERGTRRWIGWVKAWCQKIVLDRRKSEAPVFRDFESDGDLIILEQPGADIEGVVEICKQLDEAGILATIGMDPVGIGGVVDALEEAELGGDERIVGVSQGYRLMGASKSLERKVADRTFFHGDQRLLNYAVGNAKIEQKGNAQLVTKQASGVAKIDPFMALLDAAQCMAMNPEPTSSRVDAHII